MTEHRKPGCRFCGAPLHPFVGLGMSPPCESFLPAEKIDEVEPFYPLAVEVCGECFLVQLKEYVTPEEIFPEYAYFSAFSDAWLEHARQYVEMISARLRLGTDSFGRDDLPLVSKLADQAHTFIFARLAGTRSEAAAE